MRTRRSLWPIARTADPSGRELFLVNGAWVQFVEPKRVPARDGEINLRTGQQEAEVIEFRFPASAVQSISWDELMAIGASEAKAKDA